MINLDTLILKFETNQQENTTQFIISCSITEDANAWSRFQWVRAPPGVSVPITRKMGATQVDERSFLET